MTASATGKVTLGTAPLGVHDFVAVASHGAPIELSRDYLLRGSESRRLVEQFVAESRPVYGVTTGFGENVTKSISAEDAQALQANIVRSHAVSVGRPLEVELVRAVQLMVLISLGQGFSGVRPEVLELIAATMNRGVVPFAPSEGSVGYLSVEAHMALVLMGEGQAYYQGNLLPGARALEAAGLSPLRLSFKEGLALLNGTTSVTGIAAVAVSNALRCAEVADIAAALSLEGLRGTLRAFDARYHSVKAHAAQRRTAAVIAGLLKDSVIAARNLDYRLQDAYCLRCVPQVHGASSRAILDAQEVIEMEMASTGDNPIIFPGSDGGVAMSGGNFDGTFVGIAADTLCIAMTNLAKISERRTDRMVNPNFSGLPAFLVKDPGLNSGFMIAQYTAAGLVGEMKILSHPATTDSIPTSGNQEDPVSFAYSASMKGYLASRKLESVLAIELMAGCQALDFGDPREASSATRAVYDCIRRDVPTVDGDRFFHPDIAAITEKLRSGEISAAVRAAVGDQVFSPDGPEGIVFPAALRAGAQNHS